MVIKTTDCVDKKCDCSDGKNISIYSYDDIAGYYNESITYNSTEGASFMLYLYNDGTYSYRYSYDAAFGKIGNYIIKGNTISLNALAETGSGAGINGTLFNDKHVLIINDDGSLIDNDAPMFNITGVKTVSLHKTSDPLNGENEFVKFFNYSE